MNIERVAVDQSGTLRSLYDASCNIIRGQIIGDFKKEVDLCKEPVICSLIPGRTAQSQNLLEIDRNR